jgi:DNA-binding transcriptional ArsR family regulator
MRSVAHPEAEQLSLSGVLHALSDPVRLDIIRTLGQAGELSCGALRVPVSKSTLTHHLKVLRDAGLTWTRCEGVQRLVSLRQQDVERRFPGLLGCVLDQAGSASLAAGSASLASQARRADGSLFSPSSVARV